MRNIRIIQYYEPSLGYWYQIQERRLFFFWVTFPKVYTSKAQVNRAINWDTYYKENIATKVLNLNQL